MTLMLMAVVTSTPPAKALSKSIPMVAANFNHRTDQMGFRWDVNQYGMVNDGTNDCFDGAMRLNINGTQFNCSQPKMSKDGREFILVQVVRNVKVTRRIFVDTKLGGCRYVDTFENQTGSTVTMAIQHHTYLGGSCQGLLTESGTPASNALGKKDYAVLALQTSSRPSVLFMIGNPRSKIRPTIGNNSNRQFTFNYSLKLPPKKPVSLLTTIAQRRVGGTPNAKSMAVLTKPFKSQKFLADLPSKVRRTIVNWTGGVYVGDGEGGIWTMPAQLLVEQGRSDTLAIGEGTRLTGTAAFDKLVVRTRFGQKQIAIEDVAGLAGRKFRHQTPQLFLRDGQVLVGEIEASHLRFTLNSGLAMPLKLASLDRLVMKRQPTDGKPKNDASVYVELFTGDRLSVEPGQEMAFAFVTPWGPREVPLADLEQLRMIAEGQPGYHVSMKDGSRFFGYLTGGEMNLKTALLGEQKIAIAEVRAVYTPKPESEKKETIDQAHVVMTSGHVLVGRIDLPAVHVVAQGEPVPVVPSQAKLMQAEEAEDGQGLIFTIELWGGGTVKGQLKQTVLPVRVGDDVVQVPARDIAEIVVPTPVVPDALRVKIAQHIRDLGHPEWKRREAAQVSLEQVGHLAESALREAVSQTRDPEIRRRTQALLDGLK